MLSVVADTGSVNNIFQYFPVIKRMKFITYLEVILMIYLLLNLFVINGLQRYDMNMNAQILHYGINEILPLYVRFSSRSQTIRFSQTIQTLMLLVANLANIEQYKNLKIV